MKKMVDDKECPQAAPPPPTLHSELSIANATHGFCAALVSAGLHQWLRMYSIPSWVVRYAARTALTAAVSGSIMAGAAAVRVLAQRLTFYLGRIWPDLLDCKTCRAAGFANRKFT